MVSFFDTWKSWLVFLKNLKIVFNFLSGIRAVSKCVNKSQMLVSKYTKKSLNQNQNFLHQIQSFLTNFFNPCWFDIQTMQYQKRSKICPNFSEKVFRSLWYIYYKCGINTCIEQKENAWICMFLLFDCWNEVGTRLSMLLSFYTCIYDCLWAILDSFWFEFVYLPIFLIPHR